MAEGSRSIVYIFSTGRNRKRRGVHKYAPYKYKLAIVLDTTCNIV